MPFTDVFEKLGAVPQGMTPKTRNLSTGVTGYEDMSKTGQMLKGLTETMEKLEIEKEKRMKEYKNAMDFYRTMRTIHETPKAFELTEKEYPRLFGQFGSIQTMPTEPEGFFPPEGTAKVSATTQYREDINKARKGDIDWADLEDKYPDKDIDKIKQRATTQKIARQPITKKPIEKSGFWEARKKGKSWAMNPQTEAQTHSIKTFGDLIKMIQNAKALENSGVDMDALQDYYADELNELVRAGILES
jgi:hypothetical protein